MTRARSERIFEAKRTGLRNRLRGEWRVSQELADAVVAEWHVQATWDGLSPDDPRYWSEAVRWIEERFPRGHRIN